MIPVRQSIGGLGNLMFKQAYLYSQMRDQVIPDIYLQDEKYFEKYKDEIKQMYGGGVTYLDKVSIHVRRGDYFDKGDFYVDLCKTDYYHKAVAMFPNESFIVFCRDRQNLDRDIDDRAYVKDFMDDLGINYTIADEETDVQEMNMMSSSKGMIMANSTFSWWAAYLNPHNPKIVCPKQWFGDGVERCKLLDNWIKI